MSPGELVTPHPHPAARCATTAFLAQPDLAPPLTRSDNRPLSVEARVHLRAVEWTQTGG